MGSAENKLREAAARRRANNPAQVDSVYPRETDAHVQTHVQTQTHVQVHAQEPVIEKKNIQIQSKESEKMHRTHLLIPERLYSLAATEAKAHGISVSELFRQMIEQVLVR